MSKSEFGDFENTSDTFGNQEHTSPLRDKLYDFPSLVKETAADVSRLASEKVGETRDSAVKTLEQTATQMRESSTHMANETLGKVTSKLADGLQRTSTYLRTGGTSEVRSDIENLIKTRPAETIVGALAIGYLVGRMFTRR